MNKSFYFMVAVGVGMLLFLLWAMQLQQQDRYSRYDSSFGERTLCGEIRQEDVCYEESSAKGTVIYFHDKGADGILEVADVFVKVGSRQVSRMNSYKLHDGDCKDSLGLSADKPVTCLKDTDVAAQELQNAYNLARHKFLEGHPDIHDLPENIPR